MKKLFGVLAIALSLLSIQAQAQLGAVSGEIEFIRKKSADVSASEEHLFWFTLKVDKAGRCKKWGEDGVLFFANDASAYSMILAAFTAGKSVGVNFDDANRRGEWCKAKFVTLGNPPTLSWDGSN